MKKSVNIIFSLIVILFLSSCSAPDTGQRASIGSPDAKTLIEEFSDFQCPACASISPQLEDIAERNADIVRLEFYHFPLSYHEFAFMAAEAAECAGDLGKFWEYMNMAFSNQNSLTEDNLKSFASTLGLDTQVFDNCLDSGKKKARIKSDIYEGRSRQLSYTPSIYVNGQLVEWSDAEEIEKYIKSLE